MAKSGSLSQSAISRIEGRKVGGGGWGVETTRAARTQLQDYSG